jgi:hypothetical protein
MKKNILLVLIALCFPCSLLFANYDDDIWVYALHLQVKQGVLAVDTGEKYPYDLIPMQYDGSTTKDGFDFYGTLFSGKGSILAQFGFNKPTTEVVALGKSIFTVKAPYFANADHITLYRKGGEKLFNISVKDTSFCNDNSKCDSTVGENYRNCPNDCPVPTTPDSTLTNPSSGIAPSPNPSVSPKQPINITPSIPPSNTGGAPPEGEQKTNTTRVIAFVVGILTLLLGGILWLRQRK